MREKRIKLQKNINVSSTASHVPFAQPGLFMHTTSIHMEVRIFKTLDDSLSR